MTKKIVSNDLHTHIVGIWDSSKLVLKIGFQIIFIEQLLIQKYKYNKKGISIIVIDKGYVVNNKNSLVFSAISQINDLLVVKNITEVASYSVPTEFTVWNPFQSNIDLPTNTSLIQRFFGTEKKIPYIFVNKKLQEKALAFCNKHAFMQLPIVVHLKQAKSGDTKSNANLLEWKKFFINYQRYKDIVFVLIGNDDLDQFFQDLDNVICAFNKGSDLKLDLALIQNAYIFMGMASGPSNMALFSEVPYIIFKDKDHHAKDMQKELGNMNHFPFALQNQIVIRRNHSAGILMKEFTKVIGLTSKSEWRKRIIKNSFIIQ